MNQIHYWSDRFRNPAVEGARVPVRYDPFDAGTAYAFVERQWVHCYSEYHSAFQGKSEKEILLASSELRRRHHIYAGGKAVTAKKLADFLQSVESEEVLLEQRMRDREGQSSHRTELAIAPIFPTTGRDQLEKPQHTETHACAVVAAPWELYGEF